MTFNISIDISVVNASISLALIDLQFGVMFYRSDNRAPDQLRTVKITPDFITTAEGSALI